VFRFSHWFAKYRNFECRCLAMGFVFIRDRKTRKVVTMFSDCYEKLWQKKYLVALFFFSRSTTVSWWMMFVIWGEEYCEDSFLGSAIFTFTHCFLSSCKSTPSFPSWNTLPWSQVQKWEIGSSDLSSRLKKLLEMLCVFVSIWFFQRGGIWLLVQRIECEETGGYCEISTFKKLGDCFWLFGEGSELGIRSGLKLFERWIYEGSNAFRERNRLLLLTLHVESLNISSSSHRWIIALCRKIQSSLFEQKIWAESVLEP